MDSYVYLNWEALSLLINLDSNLSQIDINKSFELYLNYVPI